MCGIRLVGQNAACATEELLKANNINMMRTRLRNRLNIPCWTRRRGVPSILECLILEQVSWASVKLNTVLPVGANGLLKPKLTNIYQQDVPFTLYDTPSDLSQLSHVVLPFTAYVGGRGVHIPSERFESVYITLSELQAKAFDQGCPHWIFLQNKDKPLVWSSKAANQKHQNSGPYDISVPAPWAMPAAALLWIKFCIVKAVQDGDMQLPLLKLSQETLQWVQKAISLAHAIEDEGVQSESIGDIDWTRLERELDVQDPVQKPYAEYLPPLVRSNNSLTYSTDTDNLNNRLQYGGQLVHWTQMQEYFSYLPTAQIPQPYPGPMIAPAARMEQQLSTYVWSFDQSRTSVNSRNNPNPVIELEKLGEWNEGAEAANNGDIFYPMAYNAPASIGQQGQDSFACLPNEQIPPPDPHQMIDPGARMEQQHSEYNQGSDQNNLSLIQGDPAFNYHNSGFYPDGLGFYHNHTALQGSERIEGGPHLFSPNRWSELGQGTEGEEGARLG